MLRTTGLAAIFLGVAASGPAHAADEDTQFWLTAAASAPVSGDATATVELSERARGARAGDDQLLLRGTLDIKVASWLSLGGGAAYATSIDGDEFRPHQQATVTLHRLSFRTRFEERFFDGAARAQLRLRERVQLALPLDPKTRLSGSGELLYIVQSHLPGGDARVDQWRASVTVQRKLGKRLEVGAGYLLIVAPRSGAADRVSHVPQATLSLRL